MSPWIQTFTRRKIELFNVRPEDICIEDIARGLASMARFCGQTRTFYSVAQHSVMVSRVAGVDPLLGLLHDASEAYLHDITRPLKQALRQQGVTVYDTLEDNFCRAIRTRFGLHPTTAQIGLLQVADFRALVTESEDLLPGGPLDLWDVNKHDYPRLDVPAIVALSPEEAHDQFLCRFREVS